MASLEISIEYSGPMFDGRAIEILDRYAYDLQWEIAREAVVRIQWRLMQVLKHPTGVYQSDIHIDRSGMDLNVHDTPVVYGPWLEGVGSRNYPVTRFRGYSTFKLVAQRLQATARDIANAKLVDGGYLDELNG